MPRGAREACAALLLPRVDATKMQSVLRPRDQTEINTLEMFSVVRQVHSIRPKSQRFDRPIRGEGLGVPRGGREACAASLSLRVDAPANNSLLKIIYHYATVTICYS